MNAPQPEYVGFWARVGAAIIDTILFLVICAPLVTWVYGRDYWLDPERFGFIAGPADILINWGGKPSTGQLIGRYLAYYVSILPLMIGIIWVAFDSRKQGFHDKLARTLVVRAD